MELELGMPTASGLVFAIDACHEVEDCDDEFVEVEMDITGVVEVEGDAVTNWFAGEFCERAYQTIPAASKTMAITIIAIVTDLFLFIKNA